MKRSTARILTTHTGSLPRPDDLTAQLIARYDGPLPDEAAFNARVRAAVAETVRREAEAGIDVVNDGEMGKLGYSTYIKDRASGFATRAGAPPRALMAPDFPEWSERFAAEQSGLHRVRSTICAGPIAWRDFAAVARDLDNLKAAANGVPVEELFMTAASPGVIAWFIANEQYPDHESYLAALAALMRDEYNAIHRAGFLLQLDCPDLAFSRGRTAGATLDEFRQRVALHVAVLNEATRDIPPERMRLHLCWGNYEGPHHTDVPLKDILDIVLTARPAGLSFEGANPRHEHEWAIWQDVKLPAGKVIIPGVIDSTTNFIEHPELVAQRIGRYAGVVGRENVIAGTDCGFGTFAGVGAVDARVAWAKLAALAEGARLASAELW